MRFTLEIAYSVVAGTAIVVLFGVLGLGAWSDLQRFGETPLLTDLDGAVAASSDGRQWVTVQSAPWRCDEAIRANHTFFPARSGSGVDVVARFDRRVKCELMSRRPLTGIIEPMLAEDIERVRRHGVDLSTASPPRVLWVCTGCGRDNALLGVWMCSGLVVFGLLTHSLRAGLRALMRRWYEQNRRAAQPRTDDIVAIRTLRRGGVALLVVAAAAIAWGKDLVLFEVLPVRWVGVFIGVMGLARVVAPSAVRRVLMKLPRR